MATYAPDTVELADDSPEAMAELFETRGLGDGLPVVAPTPARVDAMLAHADGAHVQGVAELEGRHGAVAAQQLEDALARGALLFAVNSHAAVSSVIAFQTLPVEYSTRLFSVQGRVRAWGYVQVGARPQ